MTVTPPISAPIAAADLDALRRLAGPKAVVDGTDRAPHLEEWRGRWAGQTPLILAPATTDALSAIVRYCHAHDLPMVPQGGNTGLVGGQVPTGEILISTKRMTQIRQVAPENFSMTVEAGVPLATAQAAAAATGRLFPLSIGSEGSCTIGGILSTNAGGIHVIRYGNARDLALGIEAVLPDGTVWHGLNRLRKNNTGYDLKHLFMGGEGTLGIITAAVLKLFPEPQDEVTAFLGVPSAQAAVELLSFLQSRSGGQIGAFEVMNAATVDLVCQNMPAIAPPLATRTPYAILTAFESGTPKSLGPMVEQLLADALDAGLVVDGTIAQNQAQTDNLWALRHSASEAMKRDGRFCVKCDISVPIADVPPFLARAQAAIEAETPGARIIAFGHLGDGNIHYDILGPLDGDDAAWRANASHTERLVHDVVQDLGGSISAEHGIGLLKRDEMADRKDPAELNMMRAIKTALDPKGLMNPGKLIGTKPGS